MVLIPFASFLAGAILSLVMPAGLLVAIVFWYHLERRKVDEPPRETPRGSTPSQPPPGNPAQPDSSPAGGP